MAVEQVVHHGRPPEVKSKAMRMRAFWMFIIGIAMWVGVPGIWLYIGSQIKASTDSLSLALVVMAIGALVMIVALVKLLGVLNRAWLDEYEDLNERKPARSPLEPVLVISAAVALAVFGLWFTFFAGGGGPTIGQR